MGFGILDQIIRGFSVFDSNLFGSSFSVLIYLNHLSLRLAVCSYGRPLVLTPKRLHTVTFLTSSISYILLGCFQQFTFCASVYLSISSPFIGFWHLFCILY